MRPTLILFDVDGTLIDTAGAGRRAIESAFAEIFGLDGVARRAAKVPFAGMTDLTIFRTLAEAVGIDAGEQEARRERLHQAYYRALTDEMARRDPRRRVLPGVDALLAVLRPLRGVYLGLLTGNLERGARIKLEPFGLNRYFPGGGFGSDDAERREVARRAHRKLSRLFGIPFEPAQVVVVGDTEHDVRCARANGFRAVAVDSGWVPRDELERERPDALLSDLSDLDAAMGALGLDERR